MDMFLSDFLTNKTSGKPVVISGAIDEWAPRKWTLEYLEDLLGDHVVHVRHNTNCENYKVHLLSNLQIK